MVCAFCITPGECKKVVSDTVIHFAQNPYALTQTINDGCVRYRNIFSLILQTVTLYLVKLVCSAFNWMSNTARHLLLSFPQTLA